MSVMVELVGWEVSYRDASDWRATHFIREPITQEEAINRIKSECADHIHPKHSHVYAAAIVNDPRSCSLT